ncbi:MAG TPA: hypothetical protein V6C50_15095 [Crinalium sp.]
MCDLMQHFQSAIAHATLLPSSLAYRGDDELLLHQYLRQPPQR